jgi:hypothetical protein
MPPHFFLSAELYPPFYIISALGKNVNKISADRKTALRPGDAVGFGVASTEKSWYTVS